MAFKQRVKELIEICGKKLSGSRYDKFWVETILKKHNTVDKINLILDALNAIDDSLPTHEKIQAFEIEFGLLSQTEEELANKVRKEALEKEELKK